MTKGTKRNIKAFAAIQHLRPMYLVSGYTAHEQAIREHFQRGFNLNGPLLDVTNRI